MPVRKLVMGGSSVVLLALVSSLTLAPGAAAAPAGFLLGYLVVATTGCSEPEIAGAADAGAWVGAFTTEGNVTTVVNESGSLWGAPATLVEEASIGVVEGADEFQTTSRRISACFPTTAAGFGCHARDLPDA